MSIQNTSVDPTALIYPVSSPKLNRPLKGVNDTMPLTPFSFDEQDV